jgi:hypothetical protein
VKKTQLFSESRHDNGILDRCGSWTCFAFPGSSPYPARMYLIPLVALELNCFAYSRTTKVQSRHADGVSAMLNINIRPRSKDLTSRTDLEG